MKVRSLAAVSAAALALSLSGCAGAKVGEADSGGGGGAGGKSVSCGTINLAMNDWVGYTADAAVFTDVAQKALGCKVVQKSVKEQIAWQGFGTGQIDVIMENWGHPDLVKQYITDQKVAYDAGPTGNIGQIGWWVPPWLAKAHPDILQWQNLNKYASQFKTSESDGKGQLLDGDPSYVTNDGALVQNLKLNYKVVYAGSEAALITAYRQAEKNHTFLIGYFYSPQWFLSEVDLKKVALPAYTPGCDANASKVACDYPQYNLNKVVSKRFVNSDSPGFTLLRNFQWSNDDQNLVAKYITQDKMSPQAAAEKWIAANKEKVNFWLAGIPGAKQL